MSTALRTYYITALCVCVLILKILMKYNRNDQGSSNQKQRSQITRWATWLRAALYYNENLPAVCTIGNNWSIAGLLVSRAKDAHHCEKFSARLG